MKYAKVENHNNLLRDMETNAIINTDNKSYNEYLKRKTLAKQKEADQINDRKEIENMKNDIAEIKQMLLDALTKR